MCLFKKNVSGNGNVNRTLLILESDSKIVMDMLNGKNLILNEMK